ncbi:hypothetical protein [Sphingobium sp. HWE2-09]|nr:hypothetical protein [Sphingobium sp. HWE2-09]
MENNPYNAGSRDASNGQGAANLKNAPSQARERYNAGYAAERQRQQNKT